MLSDPNEMKLKTKEDICHFTYPLIEIISKFL
jgi:hypothetical protein